MGIEYKLVLKGVNVKTKTSNDIVKAGKLAVWVDFDGRYQTTRSVVRVVNFNKDTDEYLVKLEDKSWRVVGKSQVVPFEI